MQITGYIVVSGSRSIFIGMLPELPLREVISAKHERSIINFIGVAEGLFRDDLH